MGNTPIKVKEALAVGLAARDEALINEANDQIGAFNAGALAFVEALNYGPFEIITVYVAYSTIDDRGALGGIIAVSKFKATAQRFAKKRGWYGGDGAVIEKKAICVNDEDEIMLLESVTAYPLGIDLPKRFEEEKAAARAKLTNHEAQLLGIE